MASDCPLLYIKGSSLRWDVPPRTLETDAMPARSVAWPSTSSKRTVLRSHARKQRRLVKQRRAIFPFRRLPAELRIMVYELVLDYEGVDNYFHRYTEDVRVSIHQLFPAGLARNRYNKMFLPAPPVNLQIPSILLLNRETYYEAIEILRAKPLTFSHGLVEQDLNRVISVDTLRTVRHLIISDAGHLMIKGNVPRSFFGHQKLSIDLANVLKHGHSLQRLEIHFNDPDLQFHIENCWERARGCDARNWITAIYNTWRQVNDIKEVVIKGWVPAYIKEDLLRVMQGPKNFLLRMPERARRRVYDLLLDWNTASARMNRLALYVYSWENYRDENIIMNTPPILLLNKHIHAEAVQVLREKTLAIDFPLGLGCRYMPPFSTFMPDKTLVHVRHLSLTVRISADNPPYRIIEMIEHISGRKPSWTADGNGSGYNVLETLHLDFSNPRMMHTDEFGFCPNTANAAFLFPFAELRGIGKVTITGVLPARYTQGLVQRMQSPPGTEFDLEPLLSVRGDGEVTALLDSPGGGTGEDPGSPPEHNTGEEGSIGDLMAALGYTSPDT